MTDLEKMTTAQLRDRVRDNEVEIIRNEAEQRASRAEIRAHAVADLARDEELIDGLRALAWRQHDEQVVIHRREGGGIVVPEGWPPTVPDPTAHVREYVEKDVDARLDALLGPSDEPTRSEIEETPSVRQLREALG